MPASEPSNAIRRLHRQIVASGVPQVVVKDFKGRFVTFPSISPRLASMQRSSLWSSRILGVFTPEVEMETLMQEVC